VKLSPVANDFFEKKVKNKRERKTVNLLKRQNRRKNPVVNTIKLFFQAFVDKLVCFTPKFFKF
jgi:hypothetical protein